jgi:cellulose binding protein with CBM2 domain/Big-like domain-containing protein
MRIRAPLAAAAGVLPGVALVAGSMITLAGPPASAQATVCQVSYSVTSNWGTGFTASITITNEGPAISGWTLRYSYSGNQSNPSGWGGTWTESGENVAVTNASYDGNIAPGASVTIGANFTYSGTNVSPTAFTVNGTPCSNGCTEVGPFGNIVKPTAGEVFAPGSTITITANIYSGCPITSVTFYARNTNTGAVTTIGAVTSIPYTVQWKNVPVGSYLLTAVATDSPQSPVTTPPVQIYVAAVDPP